MTLFYGLLYYAFIVVVGTIACALGSFLGSRQLPLTPFYRTLFYALVGGTGTAIGGALGFFVGGHDWVIPGCHFGTAVCTCGAMAHYHTNITKSQDPRQEDD
jgi:hypothetical protein